MTDDLILEFIAESSEHLSRVEDILLTFSRQPSSIDAEALNACFRAFHTIKGCSGFLDLPRTQLLSHEGEQVLEALRTKRLLGSEAVFDGLLTVVSRLQLHIAKLRGDAVELPHDDKDCLSQLNSIIEKEFKKKEKQSKASHFEIATLSSDSSSPSAKNHEEPSEILSLAISELIACGVDDVIGITSVIDKVSQSILQGGWHIESRPIMTHVRQLLDGLNANFANDAYDEILKNFALLSTLHETPSSDEGGYVPFELSLEDANKSDSTLSEFIAEANELINIAEATVVGRKTFTREQINSIFRTFHTIKGMAAYLNLTEFERSAHNFEAQIQSVRDRILPADESFTATILRGVDIIRDLIKNIESKKGVAHKVESDKIDKPKKSVVKPMAEVDQSSKASSDDNSQSQKDVAKVTNSLFINLDDDDHLHDDAGDSGNSSASEKASNELQVHKSNGDAFSRVATSKLEDLMNQVGELLIAQAMVQHNPELIPNSHLAQAVDRQGRILRNLQVLSLSLRMVPLRGTFQKMARVVYDTAKKVEKQVEFSIKGEDTEIDRMLAEAMSDPLMHMVRNGIDHGIELPDVRLRNGKPAQGHIHLEAFQAGDDVVIRLIDDGAGMDPQWLKAKAIEKGLIDPEQHLDEQACFQLIFLPGFSTAEKVTDVSGRGVGMDVVRRQVEEADGSVNIESKIGKGTTFTIRLPMTTAILDAMQLKVGDEQLLLPINSIIEMLRPAADQVQYIFDKGQVIEHRNKMLPIVHLGETLNIQSAITNPEEAILVVIENRGVDFVIQVDAIVGQRQVVIKPFDEGVAHHPGTSGTTILGDGRVALILNPAALVNQQMNVLNS